MDYDVLANYLATDPDTIGFSGMTDVEARDAMNLERVRIKASMNGSEMWANTVPSEYNTLTDAQKSQWLSFCAIDEHNPEAGGLAQQFVVSLFGGASATVSALGSARNETYTLASDLGLGTVEDTDIAYARTR